MSRPGCDVVQVLLSPRIGGAETLAGILQATWRERGLRAETVYLDPPERARRPLSRALHLAIALRRLRPAAVLAHSALPNVYARVAAPTGIAICTVMHGGDDFADRKLRWAEHVLRLRTTAVVTVSETQRRQYRARFGRRVPVERIPNAIPAAVRIRSAPREFPRSAVTVARVAEQKQPGFWSAVVEAARTELPELRFDWWGPITHGPEVDEAAARVAASPNAALRGGTDAPETVYAEADLLFHPARAEAQSIGLLEAAASGLPIVCSEPVGRTLDAEVPRHEYPNGDVAGAIAALRAVLLDWQHVAARAAAAGRSVGDRYSPAVCAARYLEVLGLEVTPDG